MKTKLAIGDKVRVINKKRGLYGKIGVIIGTSYFSDWKVYFENGDDNFYEKDLQLIKPVRKWKYTRKDIGKQITNELKPMTGEQCKRVIKMLLAKSEHTEDKSDMLAKKDSVEQEPGGCGGGDLPCGTFTRPTLKPIEPFKVLFYYPGDLGTFKQTDEFRKWKKQITDRINLLSEKI